MEKGNRAGGHNGEHEKGEHLERDVSGGRLAFVLASLIAPEDIGVLVDAGDDPRTLAVYRAANALLRTAPKLWRVIDSVYFRHRGGVPKRLAQQALDQLRQLVHAELRDQARSK